ncbi:MAG: CPBP family intramembrane glutamic endopeptidase [Bacteroidota bacterium]
MANNNLPTTIENKFLSLAGVTASCYVIIWASPITFFSRLISVDQSPFFLQFEQHFWQYLFAFITVVVLSRGHLWSYGVNSQNLKTSMVWLVWLYGFSILATLVAIGFGIEILPVDPSHVPHGGKETVMAILVYWMSSPVANQILFFGFAQTILMKHWGDSTHIGRIPIYIYFSALLFAVGATSSQFDLGLYSAIPTFALGIFCGIVYWKTNSLITPMLAHAFYFGFPLFIHMIRSTILK